MSIARYANAPVLLVGDIDKGGVFASLFGTIALLDGDADYIKAFIINKFRGDITILEPGLRMIEEKTNRPVLGVIPYLGDLGLHEEDGIPHERFDRFKSCNELKPIKIVVLALRYISNFTDFDPFLYEPDVDLIYSLRDADIEHADLVIIPGSKNTVQDVLFLRESGIEASIKRALDKRIPIVGICGGYQMMGTKILDPYGVESQHKVIEGLSLLDVETLLEKTKVTAQVEAEVQQGAWGMGQRAGECKEKLAGYEIHMGKTTGDVGVFRIKRLVNESAIYNPQSEIVLDGSCKGNVWGTYIHGIFDNDQFRRGLINSLREMRGLIPVADTIHFGDARDRSLNSWAAVLRKSLDFDFIESLVTCKGGG
jgi:adenosylcobyric acid synthase